MAGQAVLTLGSENLLDLSTTLASTNDPTNGALADLDGKTGFALLL